MTLDASIVPNTDYVVLIGNAKVTGSNEVLEQGEGFAIVKLNH
jgi:hypothetical protein